MSVGQCLVLDIDDCWTLLGVGHFIVYVDIDECWKLMGVGL